MRGKKVLGMVLVIAMVMTAMPLLSGGGIVTPQSGKGFIDIIHSPRGGIIDERD